jgi:abortive infection bacteriophage resistance protein
MEHYSKPSLTYELQLGKLEERGMIIEDRDLARFYLQHVSYYRLSGYFYHLYQDDSHQQFKADTRFSNIIRAYNADKALRLALLNAIEFIEISVRANLAYLFSQKHSPFIFQEKNYIKGDFYKDGVLIQPYDNLKNKIDSEFDRSSEIFAVHFKKKYFKPYPIWVLLEVISLGTLSSLYKNLRTTNVKKDLARIYNMSSIDEFESALNHLLIVRNISAHHGRLWNRHIDKLFMKPKNMNSFNAEKTDSKKIYNTFLLIKHMTSHIKPQEVDFIGQLEKFFITHEEFHREYGMIKQN